MLLFGRRQSWYDRGRRKIFSILSLFPKKITLCKIFLHGMPMARSARTGQIPCFQGKIVVTLKMSVFQTQFFFKHFRLSRRWRHRTRSSATSTNQRQQFPWNVGRTRTSRRTWTQKRSRSWIRRRWGSKDLFMVYILNSTFDPKFSTRKTNLLI